jgi:prepilin-type N-terminal cleavage/methylation domain-containing protein
MNYKFPKFKSGFTLIEIVIVTAIAVSLTSVTLAVRSNSSAPRDVDSAAQQIAAQLRALQGDALNGKEVSGMTVCGFKMDTSALTSYTVSYYDCAIPTPNLIPPALPAIKLKNVTTNSIGVTFFSPYGETGDIYTIEITSNKDAAIKKVVTINSIGSVEVLGDASAVVVVACNYSYTEGPCLSGSKTLTNPVGTPAGCVGVPETTRACVSSVFCTGNYSNTWLPETCPISGTQTKNLISLSPAGCIDGGSVPATISQSCTYVSPDWISGPCAFSVYKDDIASTRQWKTSNTICGSPQCPAGALSADNSIDFSQYPARDACKSLGGRLPSRTEATCIFNNRSSYGTWLSAKYWTSEQYSGTSAWYIYMAPGFGNQSTLSKTNYEYVRCIK